MKKLIALCLVLLALGSFVFAEDAKVMPMMVGRVYVAPAFTFIPGGFDNGGDYSSYSDGTGKVMSLGIAVEYGILHWLTAALQWAPGWAFWSDIDAITPAQFKDTNRNGVTDLFLGLKTQIVGERAPIRTSNFRFAVAPGVIIPLPGPNFEDEIKDAGQGKKATFASMDRHVFAAGARVYFDWIINEHFFLNLYNETIFYPIAQDLNKDGPNLALLKANLLGKNPALKPLVDKVDGDVNYKYRLTFEIEPVYTTPIADGITFTAGLPLNYLFSPAYGYSVNNLGPIASLSNTPEKELLEAGNLVGRDSHTLSLKPNVVFFITKTPLPLEFKLQYNFPVWGKNAPAAHSIALQARVYFALPGRPE